MTKNNSIGPIIRFLLFPLVFIIEKANQGIIVGIGVLLIYPLIATIIEILKKKIHSTDIFYLCSFFGVFLGSVYIAFIGFVDWGLYQELYLIFPASLTTSVMVSGMIHADDQESLPFIDAMISAFFVVTFAFLREMLIYKTWDLRFGDFGYMYFFDTVPESGANYAYIGWVLPVSLDSVQLRAMTFAFIAFLISLFGFSKNENEGEQS